MSDEEMLQHYGILFKLLSYLNKNRFFYIRIDMHRITTLCISLLVE